MDPKLCVAINSKGREQGQFTESSNQDLHEKLHEDTLRGCYELQATHLSYNSTFS